MTGFLTNKRYKYATVYVDQYSRHGFVYLQKAASAEETLKGKIAFEMHAQSHGVRVEHYHADNGIFKAHAWVDACKQAGQGLTFAAVGAHQQNGIAKGRIRELQELARTMLIHANRRWPKGVDAHLWPYAVRMAADVLNETPSLQDAQHRSPLQLFCNTKVAVNSKNYIPFGCPVYVLDSTLQSKLPFHKWKQQWRVGIYLGRSPLHSKNVALVLDRNTALVSLQFHEKCDHNFQTAKEDDFDSNWQVKAGFSIRPNKTPTESTGRKRLLMLERAQQPSPGKKKKPLETTTSLNGNPEPSPPIEATQDGNAAAMDSQSIPKPLEVPQPSANEGASDQAGATADVTRSGRTRQPAQRLITTMNAEIVECTWGSTTGTVASELFCLETLFPDYSGHSNPLLAYKASSDPDTMYLHQAMKETDAPHFMYAMAKEVQDQMNNGNFTVTPRSAVPEGATVLPSVWQMKRKRDIKTRQVKKWKARLNIDGSRMKEGVHYKETYAQVASWNSIRMLLTLSAVHGWHTKQIDYVLAYTQAPVKEELYMHIPKGFNIEGQDTKDFVLQIHPNIYGIRTSLTSLSASLASVSPRWTNASSIAARQCTYCIPTIRFWRV
jgi:hypothetical protein